MKNKGRNENNNSAPDAEVLPDSVGKVSGKTIAEVMHSHGLARPATDLAATAGRRYGTGRFVAKGGMGAILEAEDLNIERHIAMKVILGDAKKDAGKMQRFIQEARVTGQLEHPNIVPVYELGVDDSDNVYYTMKFVRGFSLHDMLKGLAEGKHETVKRYNLNHLLNIFLKICDALALAHDRGVVHRDLKPDNIMLGDFGEVLVLDWGIAKRLGSQEPSDLSDLSDPSDVSAESAAAPGHTGAPQLTMDGQILGTPQFMAPEQALGKITETDARSDIYALGAILYNILTLHPPVEGDSLQQVLLKVVRGQISPPSTYNTSSRFTAAGQRKQEPALDMHTLGKRAGQKLMQQHAEAGKRTNSPLPHCPNGRIPAAMSAVTMKALALKQDDRYQSVAALQADIEAYQSGFATSAEAAGLWLQLRLLIKRHRREFALGLAAVVLLLAVGVVAMIRINAAKNTAVQAESLAVTEKENATQALAKYKAEQLQRRQERRIAAPALYDSAKSVLAQDNSKQAHVLLDLAMEYDPDFLLPVHLKALLQVKEQQPEQAFTLLQAAVERHNSADTRNLLELVRAARTAGADQVPALTNAAAATGVPALVLHFTQSAAERYKIHHKIILENWPKAYPRQRPDGTIILDLRSAAAEVRSLEILRGMPISELSMRECQLVTDLSPLRGMPMEELNLWGCSGVTDLSPLAGMKLTNIVLGNTAVRDLAPLKGMELTSLNLMGCVDISDLSPLKGMPLTSLSVSGRNIHDLSPLTGMPLTELTLSNTQQVSDLSPLQGMNLLNFYLTNNKQVSDLSPLQGMGLLKLSLTHTRIRDISPLQGMKLTELSVAYTQVADLSPLTGMPLTKLDLAACLNVHDLAALEGMPLAVLNLNGCRGVTDLALLKSLPLQEVILPSPFHEAAVILRGMETLTRINNKPAAEFWAEWDKRKAAGN